MQPFFNLAVQLKIFGRGISRLRLLDGEEHQMIGAESGLDVSEFEKRACEKKRAGVAMVAIVHDDEIRHLIADRVVDVTSFAAAA